MANEMGKRRLTIATTLAGALLCLMPATTSAENDFCNTRNTSYRNGELLTFKVYYNMGFVWIYAGNAVFNTVGKELNGRKVFHISGDGRTAPSYEWFYKVRDKYESFIDQETLLPVHFIRNVNEGGFKFSQDVTFAHETNTAMSAGKKFTIPTCTQDVLSAIYYARSIDYSKYKPGDKIPFDMFLDDKVYPLYIKYLGKEEIETRRGKFKAIKIVPLLIEGTIFSGGEKMTVWVSDDKNHVPLRVNSPIVVGSIKVDLMEFENLRNPFDAMLKG
jgi:hypothetical protein